MTTRPPASEAMPENSTRSRLSLDGVWRFKLEGHGDWRELAVPQPWQAAFEDLRDAAGRAIYVRHFTLPPSFVGRRVVLAFGAVSYYCEVLLNGHAVGHHEGGYLPFEIELPPARLRENNELIVKVVLPTGDADAFPDFPFAEIPHGKQSWYGVLGGVWQSVYLEARSPSHLGKPHIDSDLATAEVRVSVDTSGPEAARVVATIVDPQGAVVAQAPLDVSATAANGVIRLEKTEAWSPDRPALYRLKLELFDSHGLVDSIEETFGFRTFEARDGKFYLNGEPFYLRGALDQDYYPGTICTPPSLAFLEDQFRKAKALGLNCLRCHIKVPDPRYYEVADRLGMIIWTEIPNVEIFTEASARRLRDTMAGILVRDGNHPSIVAWTIINEDWGTRLREDPDQRQWLIETFDWLKAIDPTRLVVDNSPCAPNFHVKTDINDYHYYRTVPERRQEWDQLTAEFAAGAAWTYSPHGDAVRTGKEPLVVSEFGVWGLPQVEGLRNADGREPWWFDSGIGWADGAAAPHGIEARFDAFRLGRVFGSLKAFIDAAQWYQYRTLKYEIESMRSHAPIAGYVITELTDVHWEANGLMDMQRNPRVFADRFATINTDTVIVAKLGRYAWWSCETVPLSLSLAAGGKAVPAGCTLSWSIAGRSERATLTVPAVSALDVVALPTLSIHLPHVQAAEMVDIVLTLTGPDGATLATNEVTLALHPTRRGPMADIAVASDDETIATRMAALGYRVTDAASADIVLARDLDGRRAESIRLGAKVLLLAEKGNGGYVRSDPPPREQPHMPIYDETPGIPSPSYFFFPGYSLLERNGTIWRGDWVTNFSWIDRSGPYTALPGGPMLDLAFERVVPRAVMTGFRSWEFDARIKAGTVVGWIHKAAAFLFEKPFGKGRLLATTFRLFEDAAGEDPTATILLDALVSDLARSE